MIAKGQSNRLPGKNLKEFNGKPMFLWNLKKLLMIFDDVYVSSNSNEILELAESVGAKPILRREELCGETPDIPVFQDALRHMGNVDGIVAVHANNPLIDIDLINKTAYLLLMGSEEVMTCHPMTHGDVYKEQANKVNGSIRGMSKYRLEHYPDPYKPNPDILLVDNSIEIETQSDFDLCQSQLQSS